MNLGKALAEKGLYGEAKEVLGSVTKQSLADAEAHYNLGVILMREGTVGPGGHRVRAQRWPSTRSTPRR